MKTKSIIAALLLAASSAFAQVPSYVPTNGLVGWWPFNGNANDESGNGNNGTIMSGSNGTIIFTNDRFGISSKALRLSSNPIWNSLGPYVSITNNSSLYLNSSYTLNIWVKVASNCQTGELINKGDDNVGFFSRIQNPLAGIAFGRAGGYINHNFSIDTSQWMMCTFARDNNSGNGTLYINGTQLNTGLINTPTSNNFDLAFGAMVNGGTNGSFYPYQGSMDDIGIWNRALTQQEITALYNAQSCTSNTIAADGPTTFCAGNYVNLTSDVVGGTYQWKKNGVNISTNGTSRTYKATATGSYTCVATCNGTALTSNAIQVTSLANTFVSLTASGATSFCAGDSVTLNATNLGSGYSVQWYRTNISMQGATSYSVVVKQPGTYKTVTKNLSNGCSRISSGSVVVAVNCRLANPDIIAVDPVSDEIPATKLGNSTETTMHLFPNPNAGSFTLEYDGIEADFEVQVLNTMGQVIYNDIIPSNEKHLKTTINLGDNMQKGIYVVRIINGENVHESKVMLQ